MKFFEEVLFGFGFGLGYTITVYTLERLKLGMLVKTARRRVFYLIRRTGARRPKRMQLIKEVNDQNTTGT